MVLFWWAVAAVMVHTQTTIYGAEAKVVFSFAQGFRLRKKEDMKKEKGRGGEGRVSGPVNADLE